jgi:hypothetical protein
LQNKLFEHLAQHAPELPCSRLIMAESGENILTIEGAGQFSYYARLLTYLPGRPLAVIQPHSPADGLARRLRLRPRRPIVSGSIVPWRRGRPRWLGRPATIVGGCAPWTGSTERSS